MKIVVAGFRGLTLAAPLSFSAKSSSFDRFFVDAGDAEPDEERISLKSIDSHLRKRRGDDALRRDANDAFPDLSRRVINNFVPVVDFAR